MSKVTVAKKQHLIPRTYMRAWSYNNKDSVWVYNKEQQLAKDKENHNGLDSWKRNERNVNSINTETYYYDYRANDSVMPPEAIKEIFEVLDDYAISLDGQQLKRLTQLHQHYDRIEEWEIKTSDGTCITRRAKNELESELKQKRYTFIEESWGKEYENGWKDFIENMELKVREIKEHNQISEDLQECERKKLMEYFVMYCESAKPTFLLTNTKSPFITSERPAFRTKNESGDEGHLFVATPTMMVALSRKKSNSDRYEIYNLNEREVLEFNRQIADNGELLIIHENVMNLKSILCRE